MEWVVGTITLMAVMAAITSGGMGVRLLYIDMEYGRLIRSESERIEGAIGQRGSDGYVSGPPMNDRPETPTYERRLPDKKALSDLYAKRDSNRSGVTFDGICIIIILVDGLITALGFSPSLLISAAVTFTFFLEAVVLLQYHMRTVLRLSR